MTCQERASLTSFTSSTSLTSPKRMQFAATGYFHSETKVPTYLAYCKFWRWPVAGTTTKLRPQQPHIYILYHPGTKYLLAPHTLPSAVTSMLVLAS